MSRAGRRFLLRPSRPRVVTPSSRNITPTIYGTATFNLSMDFGGPAAPIELVIGTAYLDMHLDFGGDAAVKVKPTASLNMEMVFPVTDYEDILYTTANSSDSVQIALVSFGDYDRRYAIQPPDQEDRVPIRTIKSVEVTMDEPAIIGGRPYVPVFWGKYQGGSSADNSKLHRVPEPPPPVLDIGPPNPGNDNATTQWVWRAADLSLTSDLSKWPEHDGGPSWYSKGRYRPEVRNHTVFGKNGKYHTHSRTVYFNYRDCAHMWIDLGKNFSKDFTWVFCGIILDYPTARYGHYILDKGYNTPAVSPLPKTEAGAKILGDSGYRAAMLYQRNSSLQGSHTGNDLAKNGKHIRIQNNYNPSPRMMYSIWNNGASDNRGSLGTYGRRYKKAKGGTIDSKTMRRFVTGRRFNKVSTALASHMVLFEIRFFPRALSASELHRQYTNMASRYKFDKYPS